jgi:hypothetical protein
MRMTSAQMKWTPPAIAAPVGLDRPGRKTGGERIATGLNDQQTTAALIAPPAPNRGSDANRGPDANRGGWPAVSLDL